MSLLEQAAADAASILRDADGFGLDITVTAPKGQVTVVRGFGADIGQSIDPDTGQVVTSRRAHVTMPISDFDACAIPTGAADKRNDPWTVEFRLPGYPAPLKFRITETAPDRTVGCVVCFLTAFQG